MERSWSDPALYLPALPTVIVGLLAIFGAHWFTKRRDRAKAVYDLHSRIVETLDECIEAATEAWTYEAGDKRAAKVEETKARIASLGMSVERMRKLSHRWQWAGWEAAISGPAVFQVQIDCRVAVTELRRALTDDPFEDPDRAPETKRLATLAQARGSFVLGLDAQFNGWA